MINFAHLFLTFSMILQPYPKILVSAILDQHSFPSPPSPTPLIFQHLVEYFIFQKKILSDF
jgi:hypothetical protein